MERMGAATVGKGMSVSDENKDMAGANTEQLPELSGAAAVKNLVVLCSGGSESFGEVSDALPVMSDDSALQHIMGFWEKMVASRPASDPRSMHHPQAMRHVFLGNSNGMVDFCMVKESEEDTVIGGGGGDDKMQAACAGLGL